MKMRLILCMIFSMGILIGCSKESKDKLIHGSEIQTQQTTPTPTDINMPEVGQK